jgi:hypothetical protein
MTKSALLLAGLLASGNGFAQMGISILNAQYTTDVYVRQNQIGEQSQQGTTATPTSDSLFMAGGFLPNWDSSAQASADTFSVFASTYAFGGSAVATAETHLTFSPLSNGVAPLEFSLSGAGAADFSSGSMSLSDLTNHKSLFNYSWKWPPGDGSANNVPNWVCCSFQDTFGAPVKLLDSHDYALNLRVSTNAGSDAQSMRITMAGFTPAVPEPETWAMMLLGLGFVGYIVPRQRVRLTQATRSVRGLW